MTKISVIARVEKVDVESVSVYYGKVKALDAVSASFNMGVHAVVGPNGAGKTTLLDVIAGMLEPKSGKVVLNGTINLYGLGENERASYRRLHLAYLLQEDFFFNDMNVYENIVEPLKAIGIEPSHEEFKRVIEFMELESLLDRRPHTLSGGEIRKVGIARTMIKSNYSSIILLDEPSSSLDENSVERLVEWIRNTASQGKIFIIATHDDRLVEIADNVLKLRAGRVTRLKK